MLMQGYYTKKEEDNLATRVATLKPKLIPANTNIENYMNGTNI